MEDKRPIHINIIAGKSATKTSFYFRKATVAQLSMLNHELDIIKKEIIERIENSPKEWELEEYED